MGESKSDLFVLVTGVPDTFTVRGGISCHEFGERYLVAKENNRLRFTVGTRYVEKYDTADELMLSILTGNFV